MTRFGSAMRRVDERQPGIRLPLLSVSQTKGILRQSELSDRPPRADSLDAYKVCRQGDIVFNKMSIRSGAMGVAPEDGLVTYHYEVMRPIGGTDPRYIVYLMKSPQFTSELIRRERGIGAGGSAGVRTTEVPFSVLRTIDTFIPSAQGQSAIADYLDAQTTKIDALIGKQEQLIETLAERLDGYWSDVVSGMIERFPSVPLRRVIVSIVDGPFGSSLTSAHYSDEGAGVVRLGNIGIDEFKLDDRAYVPFDYAQSLSAHAVQPGDVVVAGLGDEKMPLGRAAIVPSSFGAGIVKADCYRVRPGARVSADYLAWILSSPQSRTQFRALSRGSTRQRLNTQVVRDVIVPLPPVDAQTEVVEKFHDVRRSNALLDSKAREMIDILKERRQALISAAVTGKIDVRGLT